VIGCYIPLVEEDEQGLSQEEFDTLTKLREMEEEG